MLSKYLRSVCTPQEFEEFAKWISNNKNDQTISQLIKSGWDEILHKGSDIPVNHTLFEKIKLAIELREKETLQRRLQIYIWAFRAAAVLLIALLVSGVFLMQRTVPVKEFVQSQSITVPNGVRSSLTLPDGSGVWLNSASALTYSSDFISDRRLTLEGEAYFEVVKSELPFVVTTSQGKVEVTGTAFNLKSLAGENQFETTVEEGSVKVISNLNPQAASLKPGQQARIENGKWILEKVETDLFTSWKDGKIIFRQEYLPQVAKRLERWYNVKIELADDPRLLDIHYTGTLEMESFSEVLELLKVAAPISYTFNDKTRVIRITYRNTKS